MQGLSSPNKLVIGEVIDAFAIPRLTPDDAELTRAREAMRGPGLEAIESVVKVLKEEQRRTGIKLLWGTANLFSHPRYAAGAATNPDPQVFTYAAAQVRHMLEITKHLGGENYVLWGGREGYETLLNTDLKRELDQLARGGGGVILLRRRAVALRPEREGGPVAARVGRCVSVGLSLVEGLVRLHGGRVEITSFRPRPPRASRGRNARDRKTRQTAQRYHSDCRAAETRVPCRFREAV